jgi:hypothetical protein
VVSCFMNVLPYVHVDQRLRAVAARRMPLSSSKCSHRNVDGGPRRQNAQPMVRAVSAKCASMRRHSW